MGRSHVNPSHSTGLFTFMLFCLSLMSRRIPVLLLVCLSILCTTPTFGQRIAERWTLTPERPATELRFGRSVAVSGDLVVVGAPGDTTNGAKSGAVYVFEYSGNEWSRTKLVPPDGEPSGRFGWKVAVDDGRIAVSAPWASNPVTERSGKVYLYERTNGTWRHELLRVSDPGVEGQIGRGLAMDKGQIVAGAPYDRTVHGDGAGSLVVFEEASEGWTSETLVPEQGSADAWFGLVVAADGDRIAGGGYHTRQASGVEAGAASVFERTRTGLWTERPLAPLVQPARKDHFGRSVAVLGPRVFVGAEEDDNANGTNAGGVFALRTDRLNDSSQLILPATGAPNSYFGYVIGTTDRVLAAYQGREVHFFSAFGDNQPRERTLTELTGAPLPGGASAMAGDGRRLVMGAAFADDPMSNTGAVLVVEFAR